MRLCFRLLDRVPSWAIGSKKFDQRRAGPPIIELTCYLMAMLERADDARSRIMKRRVMTCHSFPITHIALEQSANC
jgi:hypothetical protein